MKHHINIAPASHKKANFSILYYLQNCFLLIIPVLILNVLSTDNLPPPYQLDNFWRDIPPLIGVGENVSRAIVLFIPLLLPLTLGTRKAKIGLTVYAVGIIIYFLSWIAQLYFPQSAWSTSLAGALAPSYTPAIWLAGIALISDSLYIRIPYKSWYYAVAAVSFLAFHISHALIIYGRYF